MSGSWHVFTSGRAESEQATPEEQYIRPSWVGPPHAELGRAVDLASILGRSERGVVALSYAIAYSNGVDLRLLLRATGLSRREAAGFFHEQHMARFEPDEDPPASFLRFGIELPDGRRVSNLENPHLRPHAYEEEPDGPTLTTHGGSGGQSGPTAVETHPAYWLWPLPGEGTMRISCEWPIAGIPFTTVELETASLREAAARTVTL